MLKRKDVLLSELQKQKESIWVQNRPLQYLNSAENAR